jgi:DNA-binding IclR family transcriptional regulator
MAETPTRTPRLNTSGLRRDLELLEVLAAPEALRSGGLGVSRVAEITGRDKSQISRTLATLAETGFVHRDLENGRYSLGFQLYALAARTNEARLVEQSGQFLRKVANRTHETAHLCVLRGGNVLTLKSEMSNQAFRGVGWEGVSVPALRTSSGRALISDWNKEELRDWYEEHSADAMVTKRELLAGANSEQEVVVAMPDATRSKIKTFEDLLQEILNIRRQGYAVVDEEFELGLVGASAPIRDASNRIIGVINLSAPKTRISPVLSQVGIIVREISEEFSRHLGATASSKPSVTPAGQSRNPPQ